ncbi:MAG TPA: YicC family protein [Bacteroidales bacterium]|nr:YicC family protein [Bacteroidales bacterium]HPT02519.1 YicC family protein [Bacteroidales bacterium]
MIKSMTAYGKGAAEICGKTITVEVRSLNSRQLDINARMPLVFREKELEIRAEIGRVLERGKIDFSLSVEGEDESAGIIVNRNLAREYYREMTTLAHEFNQQVNADFISTIFRLPDVLKTESRELDQNEWEVVKTALLQALQSADIFRINEGNLLGKDMRMRIELILDYLEQVKPFEENRIVALRQRFEKNRDEFVNTHSNLDKFDPNRFEQEIFWYLEKLDITEEKVRLKKHCDYFIDVLDSAESNGRKLGFVAQEIGREINTLGSKANDAEVQKLVVQMKDELEKIKEQLGNIL